MEKHTDIFHATHFNFPSGEAKAKSPQIICDFIFLWDETHCQCQRTKMFSVREGFFPKIYLHPCLRKYRLSLLTLILRGFLWSMCTKNYE